jgi:tetratricopeptide (TPR) repeat protein
MSSAKDVFVAWDSPDASFRCLELAYLYVALGRAVGLTAYIAIVEQTFDGSRAPHACAAVFIDGKGLLADPTLGWFGAPHRSFKVLNDLETIAYHFGMTGGLSASRRACELAPGLPFVHLELFDWLVDSNRWDEARLESAEVQRLAPESEMACYSRARLAEHDGELDLAIALFKKAAESAPSMADPYVRLAGIYEDKREWAAALQAYQAALLRRTDQSTVTWVRLRIAMASSAEHYERGELVAALQECDRAIELSPDSPELYANRGITKQLKGDLEGALGDYNRATKLKPDFAIAFLNRALVQRAKGNTNAAKADYEKAISLNPSLADAYPDFKATGP